MPLLEVYLGFNKLLLEQLHLGLASAAGAEPEQQRKEGLGLSGGHTMIVQHGLCNDTADTASLLCL